MQWNDFATPGVTTPLGFGAIALAWAALFVAAWGVTFLCLSRHAEDGELKGVPVGTWALKIAMLCHHVIAGPLGILAICQDPVLLQTLRCFGCAEVAPLLIRDKEVAYAAQVLAPITVGYMAADLALISQWSLSKGSQVENMLMLVHHILSMITWPHCVWYNFCTRYVIFLITYEVSSIFLVVNWLLSSAGMKAHIMYFVSGLLFTFSFVLIRLIGGIPQILAMWHDPPWMKPTSGVPTYVWVGSIVLVLPHAMNFFWGIKVIQGFIGVAQKALGSKPKPKPEEVELSTPRSSCDETTTLTTAGSSSAR